MFPGILRITRYPELAVIHILHVQANQIVLLLVAIAGKKKVSYPHCPFPVFIMEHKMRA